LEELDLQSADLGLGGPALIAAAAATRWTGLESLNLSENSDIKFWVRALGDVSWPFLHTLALCEA
jgi:hypothetical protein